MSVIAPTPDESRAVRYRTCPYCEAAPGKWCVIKGSDRTAGVAHKDRLLADNDPADTPLAPVAESIQLALPMGPLVLNVVEGETIQQRFESFHAHNPWVCEALEALTADWLSRGRTRIGIKMLFEILRWQYGRSTTGDEFKLNNNYPSRYVRLLIDRHPEWAGVFQTRELKAA